MPRVTLRETTDGAPISTKKARTLEPPECARAHHHACELARPRGFERESPDRGPRLGMRSLQRGRGVGVKPCARYLPSAPRAMASGRSRFARARISRAVALSFDRISTTKPSPAERTRA